jgi:hypothetical protein
VTFPPVGIRTGAQLPRILEFGFAHLEVLAVFPQQAIDIHHMAIRRIHPPTKD